jgi:hypothetical protein
MDGFVKKAQLQDVGRVLPGQPQFLGSDSFLNKGKPLLRIVLLGERFASEHGDIRTNHPIRDLFQTFLTKNF